MCPAELQRIALVELEWVVFLRVQVNAYHVKPGTIVAHPGPAGTAEQVKQFWSSRHHALSGAPIPLHTVA